MSKLSQGIFKQTVRSTIISVICMLIAVLIFALVVHFACLSSNVIKTVNQFLKLLSIFLGCFSAIEENGGLIKGLLTGLMFCVVVTLIFSLVSGESFFGKESIIEIIFCGLIGLISGIISVNVKSK